MLLTNFIAVKMKQTDRLEARRIQIPLHTRHAVEVYLAYHRAWCMLPYKVAKTPYCNLVDHFHAFWGLYCFLFLLSITE